MTPDLRLDDADAVVVSLHRLADRGDLRPGTLCVLFADATSRPLCRVAVEGVPADPPRLERVRILGPLLRRVRDRVAADGALLVVARRAGPDVSPGDLAWRDAFVGATETAHLTCHGVYLATPGTVVRIGAGTRRAA